jgi:hypothetical protein
MTQVKIRPLTWSGSPPRWSAEASRIIGGHYAIAASHNAPSWIDPSKATRRWFQIEYGKGGCSDWLRQTAASLEDAKKIAQDDNDARVRAKLRARPERAVRGSRADDSNHEDGTLLLGRKP